MADKEPIKVLADILQTELGLANGFVMLPDEKYNIPKTQGLFISLEYIGSQPLGVTTSELDVDGNEVQAAVAVHSVQIDMMSFNNEARLKMPEIALAINSIYSQQQQELNHVSIAANTGLFSDNSSIESAQMMKRFTTTVNITARTQKIKAGSYFDTFQAPEVITND